jgi:ADP-glucose pyrophosphorylase
VLTQDVVVRAGAQVADSVLWPGVEIGPDSRVDGALLASGVTTGRNVQVARGALLGEGARLPDFSRTA